MLDPRPPPPPSSHLGLPAVHPATQSPGHSWGTGALLDVPPGQGADLPRACFLFISELDSFWF